MKRSKYLSDYMMYLLVMRPTMLQFEHRRNFWLEHVIDKLCHPKAPNMRALLESLLDLPESSPEDMTSTAMENLPDFARYLAKTLNQCHNKWELIEAMWIEMLLYGALSYQHVNHVRHSLGQYGRESLALIWIMVGNHILQKEIMKMEQ
ncbi:hypothetical protein SLEP1_g38575 [Rubroshorea leprosula]|nr:hypothetical protein SLEP1_g38575 [Rubroshorea leprosula]